MPAHLHDRNTLTIGRQAHEPLCSHAAGLFPSRGNALLPQLLRCLFCCLKGAMQVLSALMMPLLCHYSKKAWAPLQTTPGSCPYQCSSRPAAVPP